MNQKTIDPIAQHLLGRLRAALDDDPLVRETETLLFMQAEWCRILEGKIRKLERAAEQPSTYQPRPRLSELRSAKAPADGKPHGSGHWAHLVASQVLPDLIHAQGGNRLIRRSDIADWLESRGFPNEADRAILPGAEIPVWRSRLRTAMQMLIERQYLGSPKGAPYVVVNILRLLDDGYLKQSASSGV